MKSLREWFSGYCRSFYTGSEEEDRNIRLKEEHTHRVCANMGLLAESVGLDAADRFLAETVALFHDVGRFEQYRRYRTFKDSESVNHALLGSRVLAEERVLDALSEEDRRLVTRAVTLHNCFRVPEGLDGRSLLFLRLIRDADKLDIWRVFVDYYGQTEGERASAVALGFPDLPEWTSEVIDTLLRGEMVNLSLLRTLNDFKLLQLSWIFDLNFAASFRLVRERRYVETLAATLPADDAVARAVAFVGDHLERMGAGATTVPTS